MSHSTAKGFGLKSHLKNLRMPVYDKYCIIDIARKSVLGVPNQVRH